ncbi:FAD-dependent monooxygenase [Pseudonocardia sp. GCM10023141]|uniref:FAD-dependent monooxygenase n=1 Tax=Pseudonocardia sp. GCM10023141 TaxID=3252653 RepID=UPI00361B12F0
MVLRRVAVIGGGPGGLYAARLLKLAQPACEVVVHEQGEPDTTFGFGVGLAAGTQRRLEAADADTLRDIAASGCRHDMTMQVGGRVARVRNDRLIGVARTELLAILQRHAEKAGVRLSYGERLAPDQLDADLVIAADGVGSATREAGGFGADVEIGRGLFLWCGAGFTLPDAVFAPVATEHGTFVTHAYPYSGGNSTFLIETDERTWRNAGFDATTDGTPFDASDTASLRYLQEVFAQQLQGHPLIGNRTRWQRFRTVRCARWSAGRTVLLGDAAHTAHFSIGSGTKLAMEDAIGLVEALGQEPDPAAAFARYEAVRRPAVERLQELARRSQLWWESFASRTALPVEQLMVAYMTRAGNVPLDRFALTAPDVVGAALGQFAGQDAPPPPADLTSWVLDRPLHRDDLDLAGRVVASDALALSVVADVLADPWSAAGDSVVAAARSRRAAGAAGFRVVGPSDRDAVLTRLDLAERLRSEVGGIVVVEGPPGLRDDLAAGLVSGRADLVTWAEKGTGTGESA